MSAPALNALSPAPVMMAQRICGSSRTVCQAFEIAA